jgi:membrane carboxypeptidase/penicillin-binding protein
MRYSSLALYGPDIFNWKSGPARRRLDKQGSVTTALDRTEPTSKRCLIHRAMSSYRKSRYIADTVFNDGNMRFIGEFSDSIREIRALLQIPQGLSRAVRVALGWTGEFFNKSWNQSVVKYTPAMVVTVTLLNRVVQGGSTITQQLAKCLFTDMERSLKRKIYEMFCAREIERCYDKQDILSMYLNLIYFGNGSYGVESTAKMFFGKSVSECNEAECSMIVATLSSPRGIHLFESQNSLRKTRGF